MSRKYRIIAIFLGVLFFSQSFAISIKDMYIQRKGENDFVAFFFEKKLGSKEKSPLSKNVKFDFTYVESSDSVTILSTIVSPFSASPSKLDILDCNGTLELKPEIIYIEPKKNGMEYRLKTIICFNDWEKLFACQNSFSFKYYFESDGAILNQTYFVTKGWEDYRMKMISIINALKLSVNKK